MTRAWTLAVACALAASVATLGTGSASAQTHVHPPMDDDVHQVGLDGTVTMPASHMQGLLDETPDGGSLVVPPGTYVGSVVIDRPVSIDGRGDVVLDGDLEGPVVSITAPDVAIVGMTIRRSGTGPIGSPSGIVLEGADDTLIRDVTIEESYIGITVRLSSSVVIDGVTIRGRGTIIDERHAVDEDPPADEHAADAHEPGTVTTQIRGDGIWLWNADHAVVRDTSIEDVRDGVYVSYGVGVLVERTHIAGARYAIHDMYAEDLSIVDSTFERNLSGAVLMYGGPVSIRGTTIVESGSASTGFGILVKDVGDVAIDGNVIADNRVGVQIDDAGRTGGGASTLTGNTIALNQIGLLVLPSADAVVTGNGFVENSTQVTIGGTGTTQVTWSVDGVGNHWSDYAGYDADGDGRGDVPYEHSGRTSELLATQPLLLALASGPGFRVFARVSDEWSPSEPLVQDAAPLIDPTGPALPGAADGPSVPLAAAGLLLVLTCGAALVRVRRPVVEGVR